MRATVTIDEDVARLLDDEIRKAGMPFNEGVNHFLRIGLNTHPRPKTKPFVVTPRPMGLPAGLTYDNIGELLDRIEGPTHR